MEIDSALKATVDAATILRRTELGLDEAVVTAREAGATWAQIGDAVGISRQSAHERWGHLPRSGGCRRMDCDCPEHRPLDCPCGHGPGRGYATRRAARPVS